MDLFIQSPVDGFLGCLQFGAIVNKSTVDVNLQVFVYVFSVISWNIYVWDS